MLIGTKRALLNSKSGFQGLLDTLSASAVIAVSSRKLRSAYTGNAFQVILTSGGSTQDIPFAGNNEVDGSSSGAMKTFIGSSTGGISKWYDQSGHTNDLNYDGNAPRVPITVNAGTVQTQNGHVWNVGTSAAMTDIFKTITIAQPNTIGIVVKLTTAATGNNILGDFTNNSFSFATGFSGPNFFFGEGTNLVGPATDTNIHGFLLNGNGASSQIIMDGGTPTTGNGGTNSILEFDIYSFNGNCSVAEVIVFPSTLSSSDQTKIFNSWANWWGIP